jgi:hypothetical protein
LVSIFDTQNLHYDMTTIESHQDNLMAATLDWFLYLHQVELQMAWV